MDGKSFGALILAIVLACSPLHGATVSTFEDIDFWIGEGKNCAAIVIDWDSSRAEDESLVWGFRWNDTATGEDMLRAALAADHRLFAKLGEAGGFGLPVYGIGYDLNDDDNFAISDATAFNDQGVAITGVPDQPPQNVVAISTDSADHYAEGFFTGFWHYGISDGSPFDGGGWLSSAQGSTDRILSSGDWNSWAFETPPRLFSTAFAANPMAAEAPFSADFDDDQDIDGADFLIWQRGWGLAENALPQQGDANGDGRVDAHDLQLWSAGYGRTAVQSVALSVPEPCAAYYILGVFFVFCFTCFSPRSR